MKTLSLLLASALAASAQTAAPASLIPLPAPRPPAPAAPAAPPKSDPKPLAPDAAVSDAEARLELARVLSYLKRYDEALAEYKKALALRPSDNALLAEQGRVFFWAGRRDEALAVLSQIPSAQLDADSRLALADIRIARGEFALAEPLLREHLKAKPSDDAVKFKLAELLAWTKRYDESLALYGELLAARPDDTQLRRRHAYVLLWAGRHEEAAAELKRTLPQ